VAFKLSRKAEDDLIDIYAFGAIEFGFDQADRYQNSLEQAFRFLADFPQAARERMEIDPPVRGYACRSHVIIYVIDGLDVHVLRVRHGREAWTSIPDNEPAA